MVEIIRARRGPITLVGIKIEPEEPFVLVGESKQLTVRAQPKAANKGAITWRGGGTAITLSSDGLITGVTAESRLNVQAISDAGFSAWMYARCGYDVTAISLESSSLTIEGIQGVLFALSVTPSDSTEISFKFESDDSSIADYYWTSTANTQRMWGYGVGQTTVTAKGRSGNAEYPVAVTVTPVQVESIETRFNNGTGASETTEQGDTIPGTDNVRYALAGCKWNEPIYFFPFNTTERYLEAESDNPDVVEVVSINENDFSRANRTYGTFRTRTVTLRSKAVGEANITFKALRGEPITLTVNVVESMMGTASNTSVKYNPASMTIRMPYAIHRIVCMDFYDNASVADNSRITNWYNSGNVWTIWANSQSGSKGYARVTQIYAYIEKEDGTQVRVSSIGSIYMDLS